VNGTRKVSECGKYELIGDRCILRKKGTLRVPGVLPELWQHLSQEQRMAIRSRWLLYVDECQARGAPVSVPVPEEGVSSRRRPPPMTELRRHTEEKAKARWRKRPESAARPCRWVPQDSLCTVTTS